LFAWMAGYYMCHEGEVLNAALPAGLKPKSATSIVLLDVPEDPKVLTDKEYMIMEALELHQRLDLREATAILGTKNPRPLLARMADKGYLRLEEEVEYQYRPKTVACLA